MPFWCFDVGVRYFNRNLLEDLIKHIECSDVVAECDKLAGVSMNVSMWGC